MAEFRWHHTYRARSSRRFTHDDGEHSLTLWATDQLNLYYDQLRAFFHAELPVVREAVRNRSRVDTGFMRSNVEAFEFGSLALVGIEFGWSEGAPHYAPYQEFGVPSHNIKPMRAVQQTYHESWARTRTEVGTGGR